MSSDNRSADRTDYVLVACDCSCRDNSRTLQTEMSMAAWIQSGRDLVDHTDNALVFIVGLQGVRGHNRHRCTRWSVELVVVATCRCHGNRWKIRRSSGSHVILHRKVCRSSRLCRAVYIKSCHRRRLRRIAVRTPCVGHRHMPRCQRRRCRAVRQCRSMYC